MEPSKARLHHLFDRYMKNIATEREKDQLFFLLDQANDDDQLARMLQDAWNGLEEEEQVLDSDKSGQIMASIFHTKNERQSRPKVYPFLNIIKGHWRKVSVAASIAVIVSLGTYFYVKQPVPVKQEVVKARTIKDLAPGGNKALLTLGDGTTIVLDNAKNGVLANQGNITISKTQNGQVLYTIKADGYTIQAPTFNTISTPRGGQYQVQLPDGTRVWLNAASSLRFPTAFTANERRVELIGEAYFEVEKDKARPFNVTTGKTTINVLGTHFNVMAYPDEPGQATTLMEGSVQITNGSSQAILIPGQQASISGIRNKIDIKQVNADDAIAWKNGSFVFNEENIESIMRKISRWYDADVTYSGKLTGQDFSGVVSRFENVSEVLKMLQLTGTVQFKLEEIKGTKQTERRITVMP